MACFAHFTSQHRLAFYPGKLGTDRIRNHRDAGEKHKVQACFGLSRWSREDRCAWQSPALPKCNTLLWGVRADSSVPVPAKTSLLPRKGNPKLPSSTSTVSLTRAQKHEPRRKLLLLGSLGLLSSFLSVPWTWKRPSQQRGLSAAVPSMEGHGEAFPSVQRKPDYLTLPLVETSNISTCL